MNKTSVEGFVFLFQSQRNGGRAMCCREAMRILMLSPIYWRLSPAQRWEAIKYFCSSYNK